MTARMSVRRLPPPGLAGGIKLTVCTARSAARSRRAPRNMAGRRRRCSRSSPNLLHFGMVVVGLDYGHAGQMTLDEITGSSPYGASTIAGGDGSRWPSENEL